MTALTFNGKRVKVNDDRHRTLLQALREELHLTGTKYGCGEGQCGACTVLLDGKPVRSCILPLSAVKNRKIITIEGLSVNGKLHPVQQAFLDEDAMQCGYCVPGMILTAVSFLNENPNPTHKEIVEGMNGNICRCCNYTRITAAVKRASEMNVKEKSRG